MTIYVDDTPINVDEYYAAQGFDCLPQTPTMMGAVIAMKGGGHRRLEHYALHKNEKPLGPEIRDTEAVPLRDGMKFCLVPYAAR